MVDLVPSNRHHFKANSNDYSIKDDEIKKRILELKKCEIDLWQVCSGHDLTKILALIPKNRTLCANIPKISLSYFYSKSYN